MATLLEVTGVMLEFIRIGVEIPVVVLEVLILYNPIYGPICHSGMDLLFP